MEKSYPQVVILCFNKIGELFLNGIIQIKI